MAVDSAAMIAFLAGLVVGGQILYGLRGVIREGIRDRHAHEADPDPENNSTADPRTSPE